MSNKENTKWVINLRNIDLGIFRSMNGSADEMIAIGRIIKAGFPCSKVDVTNARYDAVVDIGGLQKLLRIQIKGTGTNTINFTGGGRSGQQISREVDSRVYKYTEKDCDLIIGINTNNGECYIIPIKDIEKFGTSKRFSTLEKYRENWSILIDLAKNQKND